MKEKIYQVMRKLFQDAVDICMKGKEVRSIIRNYNDETVDISFPSRQGVATNLPVRQLLLTRSSHKYRTAKRNQSDAKDDV